MLCIGNKLYITNVGDSRSIIVKKNCSFYAVSFDHKPNVINERLRIERNGGFISQDGSVYRVEGKLSVSRSFGDKDLKDYVICQPDICMHEKDDEDMCIVIGSDGLWDVLSNSEVSITTYRLLRNNNGSCQHAADELVRLALQRGSTDNVFLCYIIFIFYN